MALQRMALQRMEDMNGDEAQRRANGHAEPSEAQAPQEPELSTGNLNGVLSIV